MSVKFSIKNQGGQDAGSCLIWGVLDKDCQKVSINVLVKMKHFRKVCTRLQKGKQKQNTEAWSMCMPLWSKGYVLKAHYSIIEVISWKQKYSTFESWNDFYKTI